MLLGWVGLGRMGANMGRRLLRAGHRLRVWDASPEALHGVEGAEVATSLEALVEGLPRPRILWLMLPAGAATETTVEHLGRILDPGDTVVEGGNGWFKDDVRRAGQLSLRGIEYVDVGTSGGIWGLERGYCLMIGGSAAAVGGLEPVFRDLAPGASEPQREGGTAPFGYLHCGPVGAGHFVKMVHNGIEYGLMQAYAEGFHLMGSADGPGRPEAERYTLDLGAIAEVWRRGSVVSSWLLDLTARALARSPELSEFAGHVSDSGEGRWTLLAAIEQAVPVDVLGAALFARFRSRQDHTFAEKLLSALRHEFGGHQEVLPPSDSV